MTGVADRWDHRLHWSVRRTSLGKETLSLDLVRDLHLKIPTDDEDLYLLALLRVSRGAAERYLQRAIPDQTWVQTMDGFPSCRDYVEVPFPPLITVTSITYVDQDGATQTWASDQYQVLESGREQNRRARIGLAYNVIWPTTRAQRNAVTVTYRAGYVTGSPEAPDVPADIEQGRLLVVGELYKQRSQSVHALNQSAALLRAQDLWAPHRVF